MKRKIKIISKFITNLVVSSIISSRVASALSKYCNNIPLWILMNVANFITTWTLTDVVLYLVEKAYEHGDLTLCELCEVAEIIDNIKNSNKEEIEND